MIAPVREPRRGASGLATARRSVAAALLRRSARRSSPAPSVSSLMAWSFVAWAVAVAVAYFGLSTWWAFRPY
jgi:hypothetical protein